MLPTGSFVLANPSLGSRILVRACYVTLLDAFQHPPLPNRNFIITGNPGIGKSVFSAYAMFVARRQGRTVVWRPAPTSKASEDRACYLMRPNGAVVVVPINTPELRDPNVWQIVDAQTPFVTTAPTLLVTSPRRVVYKEYRNDPSVAIRYMPLWSSAELDSLYVASYGERLAEAVYRRLGDACGGVPRMVLEHPTRGVDPFVEMEAAINRSNLELCMASDGEIEANDAQISYHLLHAHPQNDSFGQPYGAKTLRIASDWVAERLAETLAGQDEAKLVRYLRQPHEWHEGGMYGVLFELYAHRRLCRGGRWTLRALNEAALGMDQIVLERPGGLVRRRFHSVDEVDLRPGTDAEPNHVYYVPHSKSFAAVDAFIGPGFLLQMTVSTTHPINRDGLTAARRRVNGVHPS